MNCTTPYCRNTNHEQWHAPEGYSTVTVKNEAFNHCPECGAKWRDPRLIGTGLRGFVTGMNEFRARSGDTGLFARRGA